MNRSDVNRLVKNQQSLKSEIDRITKKYNTIPDKVDRQKVDAVLIPQIDKWEKRAIEKIKSTAEDARKGLRQAVDESSMQLKDLRSRIMKELPKLKSDKITAKDIAQIDQLLEDCRAAVKETSEIKLVTEDALQLNPIQIQKGLPSLKKAASVPARTPENLAEKPDWSPTPRERRAAGGSEQRNEVDSFAASRPRAEPAVIFKRDDSRYQKIQPIFEFLETLAPMDKNGAMSGNCDIETTQMENFLAEMFGFRNIDGQEIVQGVKFFQLGKPLHSTKPEKTISFPSKMNPLFNMTVAEIVKWQKTYVVYADKTEQGLDEQFLHKALQGLSEYGKEAFHMKFVVRISSCPILMEFDGRTIPRKLEDQWPDLIKLVSVTGVDFAGRIHDVDDVRTYVSNYQDVYEMDHRTGYPVVYGRRDFRRRKRGPLGQLREDLLFKDLCRMARFRLRACDHEGIQIVVETGIGLGVFAGKAIGIDQKVRELSALAIRKVLEKDGSSYQNILGIVFALPVFDQDRRDGRKEDTYQAFVDEFNRNKYQGPIPVMIADQDMHRLAVAIAKQGLRVSELNPADSHGVFGEYWQNRGPAVEEKLALTTLGLLVQHHLINPYVLDFNHYRVV